MDMKYRKFTYEDIPKLIDLRIMQLKDEGAVANCDIVPHLKEYYKTHIINETFVGYVAEYDDTIIATSGLSFMSKPPWYENLKGKIGVLSSVFIDEKYRRHGIATKLVHLMIEEAKSLGYNQIHITSSKDGINLYKSLGFELKNNFLVYKII